MRELQSSGQTKVQRSLNRSEAELGEANVPERLVYALYKWRDLLPFAAKGVTGSMAYTVC